MSSHIIPKRIIFKWNFERRVETYMRAKSAEKMKMEKSVSWSCRQKDHKLFKEFKEGTVAHANKVTGDA